MLDVVASFRPKDAYVGPFVADALPDALLIHALALLARMEAEGVAPNVFFCIIGAAGAGGGKEEPIGHHACGAAGVEGRGVSEVAGAELGDVSGCPIGRHACGGAALKPKTAPPCGMYPFATPPS